MKRVESLIDAHALVLVQPPKMNRTFRVFCALAILLIMAHRLPAPIFEEETPTPAPEQSATLKPKPTLKPKIATESFEDSAKQQTASPITGKSDYFHESRNRRLFEKRARPPRRKTRGLPKNRASDRT